MRSIVRRDTGESYDAFLTRLAEASGLSTPTRAELARFDRTRKKKGSNDDWTHPHDPDAKIAKMKDGRTHRGARPPSMRSTWTQGCAAEDAIVGAHGAGRECGRHD